MKNIFTYKNIVTALIFITVWTVIWLTNNCYKNYAEVGRYKFEMVASTLPIIFDTKTGVYYVREGKHDWIKEK